MNIAIIGYGKMGKMVEKAAIETGIKISAIVDPLFQGSLAMSGVEVQKNIEASGRLNNADIAIEFTSPHTVIPNIKTLADTGIPSIIGTTGWHDKLDEVKKIIILAGTSLLWSSNFSLGVNVFYRIAWYAAQLLNEFPEYDIAGFESHHNKKLDSPSGTARTLVQGILSRMDRKKKAVWETLNRAPEPDELHFPSLRLGSVPGTHSLIFDSPADTIEITHTARSREAFASGALCAAQWLIEKNSEKGVFTIDEMLRDITGI